MKKTALIALLCLVLCVSLFPVSAFADQTVVIIGGAIPQNSSVVTQESVAQNTTAGTIVSDGNNSNIIVNSQELASPSSSVIVMPNGTIVTSQPAQNTQAAAATESAAQAVTKPASAVPAGLAGEIYKKINAVRTANGLGILGYDAQLQGAADVRAKESASVFGHTRPDGSAAVTAVTVNYNVAGENLIQVTKEFATADIIVETWLNSPTHKANIMLADFSQTAIGVYESSGTLFISQIFSD